MPQINILQRCQNEALPYYDLENNLDDVHEVI